MKTENTKSRAESSFTMSNNNFYNNIKEKVPQKYFFSYIFFIFHVYFYNLFQCSYLLRQVKWNIFQKY